MKKQTLRKKVALASILGISLFAGSTLYADSNTMMDHSKMNVKECTKMYKIMHDKLQADESLTQRWKAFDELSAKIYPEGLDGGNN